MALAEVSKGIHLGQLAEEIDRSWASASRWKNGKASPPVDFTRVLARRGRFLASASFDRYDFDWVCEEFGVKHAFIAKRLGITRQAFAESRANGFTAERKRDIERIVRRLGRDMLQLSRRKT